MGIKQLYNDGLRKLSNDYGDVSVMQSGFNVVKYIAKMQVEGQCKPGSYCSFRIRLLMGLHCLPRPVCPKT